MISLLLQFSIDSIPMLRSLGFLDIFPKSYQVVGPSSHVLLAPKSLLALERCVCLLGNEPTAS